MVDARLGSLRKHVAASTIRFDHFADQRLIMRIRVVKRAITHTTQDFVVIQGVRTKAQMWENYGKGRTAAQCLAKGVPAQYAKPTLPKVTWLANPLMSNHRVHADGFGHAVDIVPFPVDWNSERKFNDIAAAMKRAAHLEGVKIVWGRSQMTR